MIPPLRATPPPRALSAAALLLTAFGLLLAPPPAAAEDVPVPEDALVSITGTAHGNAHQSFRLRYGDHSIQVEMKGIPEYPTNRSKVHAKKTTVYGRLDRDFPVREDIHALIVYVHDNGAVFRAERQGATPTMQDVDQLREMPEVGTLGIAGILRNRGGDVLTVGTPGGEVKFDVSGLPEGMRKLDGLAPGRGVMVHAELKDATPLLQLYKGPALRATAVAPLPEGPRSAPGSGRRPD